MAQDFERNTANAVGTGATTLRTANSDDAIVGITVANVHSSQITVEVYINDGSNDIHIVKDAPIPVCYSLELLTGGKVILETTDVLRVDCSVADKLSGTLSIMEIT